MSLRPQRSSLVAETVKSLRTANLSGHWSIHLPGERRLCEDWGISRPTLRAAQAVLAREGLLKVAHGCRTVIANADVPKASACPLSVALLSPEPLHAMPPFALLWLDELRARLQAAGHQLQVHAGRVECASKNPGRALRSLVDGSPAAAWVLFQSTEAVQQWFAAHEIPSLVVGSVFPGVPLPSVDRDYRAVCAHAVGHLVRKGHQHLAFLIQKEQFGGDWESAAGFGEGLSAMTKKGVTGHVVLHEGTATSVMTAVDSILAMRPRPTAMLVARTRFALTAFTHLLGRGVKVPRDMAMICRDDDGFLDHVVPRMARYTFSPEVFARHLVRQVLRLVNQGAVQGASVKVLPEFLKRESA